jgi:hypothetical protein
LKTFLGVAHMLRDFSEWRFLLNSRYLFSDNI